MTDQKTVVILGAGWAGLPLAHKLLKYTSSKTAMKVILVSPNSHFFWNVAATRGLIPGMIPDESMFIPIATGFEHYAVDLFEFVLGRATDIQSSSNSVTILTNTGGSRTLHYHQLVTATGSRLASGLPLKPIGTHEETLTAWHELQTNVSRATDIVVAGAGPTGVEVAGELAAKFGKLKKITLIMRGDVPLESSSDVLSSVRTTLDKDLQKLGVELIRKTCVKAVEAGDDGKTQVLILDNGSRIVTELYLPCHGIRLNNGFISDSFLDPHGNANIDDNMRVVGTENIWAIGDVSNAGPKQLTVTDNQIVYLAGALDAALTGKDSIASYQPVKKPMIFLSLGRKYATGQIGSWKLWGALVSYVKGRNLFVDTAEGYVSGKHLRHSSM
ncbi:FAD binding domain protein [Trichoderma guizhouense]|uniref:FAD binding domain protein n=1 Tax=Trichoderma guizhouense TaxID=1491466 RepID=A0A1T3CLB8_9HYPO|nr:FAD binding domain protein [Trichoderma guizhouense]